MRNMTPFLQYVMKFNIISFHFCFLVSKSLEGTGATRTFDLVTSDVHLAPGGMLGMILSWFTLPIMIKDVGTGYCIVV